MGGGGIDSSQNSLKSVAGQQDATGQALLAQSQQLIDKGQAEQAPLVNFLKGIMGGNSTQTQQTLAPVIGNITNATNANREQIFSSTAPGAGRDVLLGENQRSQATQVAGATNQTFLQAFPELAGLAGGNTNAGLGLTGAGITSTGNSASTTGNLLNAQEQQKANSLNAWTGLAGTIATGGATAGAAALHK